MGARAGVRRVLWVCLGMLSCTGLAGCERAAESPPGPSLCVLQPDHDFGRLLLGERREHQFLLENRGRATLEVSSVRSSCGCAVLGESSFSLPAGEEKLLSLRLHADEGPGDLVKTVVIASNDPESPHTILHFRARIDPIYALDPPAVDFGVKVLGQQEARTVRVSRVEGGALELRAPESNVVVAARHAAVPGAEGTYEVTLTLHGDLAAGEKILHVVIPTDHPSGIPLRVPVKVQMVAPWRLVPPETLYLGPVSAGAKSEVAVLAAAVLEHLPTIDVQLDAELQRILVAHWSQVEGRLLLEVRADARHGNFLGALHLRSQDPVPFVRTLSVEGSVKD